MQPIHSKCQFFKDLSKRPLKVLILKLINSGCVQLSKVYICNFAHNWAPSRSAHLRNFCEVRDNVQNPWWGSFKFRFGWVEFQGAQYQSWKITSLSQETLVFFSFWYIVFIVPLQTEQILSQKWLSFLSKMMQDEREAVNFARPKVCRTQFLQKTFEGSDRKSLWFLQMHEHLKPNSWTWEWLENKPTISDQATTQGESLNVWLKMNTGVWPVM